MSANYVKNTTGPKKNDPVNLLSGASTDNVTGKTIDPNSYGANVGGVTPAPTVDASSYGTMGSAPNKVSTYGEFLTSKEAMAKSTYDSTVKRLDDLNAETLAKIESDRQKGVRNAGNAYEQSKASYGSNAEALRRMGLSGSGYSDYLESSAYAASRSEIGAINAGATESARAANSETEKNKFDALNTYNANISEIASERAKFEESERLRAEEEDAAKKTAFQTLLTNINSGIYTDYDQIQKLAADAGLSAEEAQQLVNSAAQLDAKNKAATSYELMSDDEKNSVAGIQAAIDAGAITYKAGVAKLEQIQKDNYNAIIKQINDTTGTLGVFDENSIADVEALYDKGLLTKPQHTAIVALFQKSIARDDNFFKRADGSGYMSEAEATVAKDALLKTGWVTKESGIYKDIEAAFNKRYGVVIGGYMHFPGSDTKKPKAGKNISYYTKEKKYNLEIGGIVANETVKSFEDKVSGISEGKIFKHGNNIYTKIDGTFYYIHGIGGVDTADYNALLRKLSN